jgi:hypothetical protein
MNTLYELWDFETGNCIGAYEDVETAFADVRDTVRRYGTQAATSLVLLTAPDDMEGERIAAGNDLIERAAAAAPKVLPARNPQTKVRA